MGLRGGRPHQEGRPLPPGLVRAARRPHIRPDGQAVPRHPDRRPPNETQRAPVDHQHHLAAEGPAQLLQDAELVLEQAPDGVQPFVDGRPPVRRAAGRQEAGRDPGEDRQGGGDGFPGQDTQVNGFRLRGRSIAVAAAVGKVGSVVSKGCFAGMEKFEILLFRDV